MMEAARTSETLVNFYQTTRRNNPEDSHLRSLPCSQEPAIGRGGVPNRKLNVNPTELEIIVRIIIPVLSNADLKKKRLVASIIFRNKSL
jgi:hypothetical protein